jgi:hypothetical protein
MTRKGTFLITLGLSFALTLAAVSPAAAVSTLTGETLSGRSPRGNTPTCPAPTFNVRGTATDPYPGTFSETGSWEPRPLPALNFTAAFTITSDATTITGSKTNGTGFSLTCSLPAAEAQLTNASYTATIHTPNGNFHDEGQSAVHVTITPEGAATLTETFTSSLAQPVLIAPTTKNQCKNGGWKAFPQFRNQGKCVSSFQRQPQP